MAGNKKREYEPIRDRNTPRPHYSAPAPPTSNSSTSSTPSRIPPYDIEAGKFAILERQKHLWSSLDARARKIQLLAILQIFIGIVVSMDSAWYTHIFGIAIGCVGLIAVRGDKPDVLLVYMLLCLVEFIKNIGYMQDVWSHWGMPPPTRTANGTDMIEYPSANEASVNRWVAVGLENKYLIFQMVMVIIEETLVIPFVMVLGYSSVQTSLQNF
ncbi:Aste57867_8918 [Aphanomyces stellatus]|uniref:Aste57867_8918 protein n=1 Tax=Aphanomyces stellatus TaxID=120398 RepID=A0A485KLM7_9STRA|nr:hypothetical protein As57867_008883 [Aphanomyces stellatus]VFT85802.1 Aste57867_8918 [Aphanomyces stellatus]